MNMRRIGTIGGIGAAIAMALAAPSMAYEPEADHTPAPATIRTRHKPSGSKPVSGGGARERARRMARMDKLEAEANGGEGTDPFDTSEVE